MKNLVKKEVLFNALKEQYKVKYGVNAFKPNSTKIDNLKKIEKIVENSKLEFLKDNKNLGMISEQAVIEILKGVSTSNNTNGVDMVLNNQAKEIKLVSHNKAHEIATDTFIIAIVVTANVNGVYTIASKTIRDNNLIGKRLNQGDILKYGSFQKTYTSKVFKGIAL